MTIVMITAAADDDDVIVDSLQLFFNRIKLLFRFFSVFECVNLEKERKK